MEIAKLIRHFYQRAPGFARRLEDAGLSPDDIRTEDDLAKIPVLRKESLVEVQAQNPPFGGLLAVPLNHLKRIFQSPGPIYDPEGLAPDYWRWSEALRAAGFGPEDVVLNAFAYHLTPAGAMFEEGLRAVGCTIIPGGVGQQELQIRAMHDLGVTGYVGLPSYLLALLKRAREMDMALQVRKAFVTAEPLPPSLRQELHAYGVEVVRQGYGTAECGNLGYECEYEDGWHIPEGVLVQICDINTGQPLPPGQVGEIVVTLFQREYALIRFGTGDLSVLNTEPCPCGRSSPRLMGWRGRVGDAVKVRGLFVHPHQLQKMMQRFPEVERWQAVVHREAHVDQMTLKIVAPSSPPELDDALRQAAREILKLRITVKRVDTLPEDAKPLVDTREWE